MEVLIALAVVGWYLVPSSIAVLRHKRNVVPIVLVNLLLGWTVIGWVVALVWAFMYEQQPRGAEPRDRPKRTPGNARTVWKAPDRR